MWQPFEEGRTVGQTGTEGGVIVFDEEHDGGARITLERGCLRAPFAITCGVYGWMVHTRFLADDETAQHAYSGMKSALSGIVTMLPEEDDIDAGEKLDAVTESISEFVEKFA
jgi:hypothetical protein